MNKKNVLENTKKFVRERLEGEGSGHDWWHIVRVYNTAISLLKNETEEVNEIIIKLGALLHDVADHKFGYTDEDRKNIIEKLLIPMEVDPSIINEVIYIVNNISFKGGTNKVVFESLEGKIVQDADRLDAIGAIGIGRTFAYGGHVKRVMYNPDKSSSNNDDEKDTISHFYEKLLLLKDKMNTRSGKEQAIKKHEFMKQYLEQFYLEWDGEL